MAALLQWRKFNFFDVTANVDSGRLAEALKGAEVTCTAGGRGHVYIGDSAGCVHGLNRQLKITSFEAHSEPVRCITAFDHTNIVITIADSSGGGLSEVKVWSPDKLDSRGRPLCLRSLAPDPRPAQGSQRQSQASKHGSGRSQVPRVTALAVHPNLSLMAVGCSDGSIILYRGEVSRERGSKQKVLLTVSSGLTSLHLRHTTRSTHLFATTHTHTYCINLTVRDKETTVELDTQGCEPGCSTLADGRHEHHFLVARSDALYSYTTDSRGSCYVFEGEKALVVWFRGYLIVAAADKGMPATSSERSITIYDLTNKLVALSTRVRGLAGVVGEWGGLYLVTSEPSLIHMSEKDLHSKFQLLFKKNQFDIAISLAKTQCCDQEEVAEILKQYGDWLYSKGNHAAAMEQYLKTVPHLEPSYVIRKYLDTQHIHNLTTYLQALHRTGSATADHTSLLLNCYTRLRDTQQLNEFIMSKEGAVECDVELGVRVCRSAGYYDHALALAARHGLHHHHLAILIDDKKDYSAALRYMATLELEEAKANVLRYGSVLLGHHPDQTTELLISLCTDYKPSNSPIVKEGSLDSYPTPEDPVRADPEEFEYLLVGHSEQAITFLERLADPHTPNRQPLSPRLYTTLLAEYLHQYSLAPEGQDQVALGEKVLALLRNSDTKVCRDQALLLCDKHKFQDGKLLLWEQAGMFEEMLAWHGERGEVEAALGVCSRKAQQQPSLWCSMLRLLASPSSPNPPNPHHLSTCLNNIEEKGLMPALEVMEVLSSSPHITLGQVRDYLLGVVASHSTMLASETTRSQQYSQETAKMRDTIRELRTSATQFTSTKCNICNNELELPSVHFLCKHSFHQHCFESYSESEADCPVCLPENKKMMEIIKAQETHRSQHDHFHEQLERSAADSFTVVADYLGRGVFTQLQSLSALYPPLNTTRKELGMVATAGRGVRGGEVPDSSQEGGRHSRQPSQTQLSGTTLVPEVDTRLRALEKAIPGPASVSSEGRLRVKEGKGLVVLEPEPEGRMRLEDHAGKPKFTLGSGSSRPADPQSMPTLVSPSEAQLRSSLSSNIMVPSSEGRVRGVEASRMGAGMAATKSSPNLHDHITRSPQISRPVDRHSVNPAVESISSALASTQISSSPRTKPSDNPFQDKAEPEAPGGNPFGDFETENMEGNPFADDYDESKNPFAADSPSPDSKNPFGSDDYDSSLNPFGES
ncbi:vacuolar protein sorting-associated protein 11 homolog isoform X2 [Eriocheir sinensis]|uniref:vacuolar protein sorting-associated protein 11 homolog isoform X2 n=1 Tax=Eriocheir sinensis TaxID=95602 RepID=UPI0021C8E26D|nr:vacuolar protein sorting-associated protein 11 homolog isoform X2 [Eriocheir sinensis]